MEDKEEEEEGSVEFQQLQKMATLIPLLEPVSAEVNKCVSGAERDTIWTYPILQNTMLTTRTTRTITIPMNGLGFGPPTTGPASKQKAAKWN